MKKTTVMLCQEDLPEYIENAMPELAVGSKKDKPQNVYDIMRHLLKYTRSQVIKHNLSAAKKCMTLVSQLYYKGNNVIKNAIENIYVYSFSHAFFHDEEQKKEIMDIVPDTLYKLYRSQVVNSHL
jgi:hypothetical protein